MDLDPNSDSELFGSLDLDPNNSESEFDWGNGNFAPHKRQKTKKPTLRTQKRRRFHSNTHSLALAVVNNSDRSSSDSNITIQVNSICFAIIGSLCVIVNLCPFFFGTVC